jgi:hypothetical protein
MLVKIPVFHCNIKKIGKDEVMRMTNLFRVTIRLGVKFLKSSKSGDLNNSFNPKVTRPK